MTVVEFQAKVRTLGAVIEANKTRLLIVAASTTLGEMGYRIFNRGLDANELPLGGYRSAGWRRIRESKGRQTAYKDLQFTGNLFQALQMGETGGDVVIGFTDGDYPPDYARMFNPKAKPQRAKKIFKVAEYIEEQLDTTIFAASDNEVQVIFEVIEREIQFILDKF